MAQPVKQKFKNGDKNFPILYEDQRVLVYKNPTGEIFVESLTGEVTMRIGIAPGPDGALQFTAVGRVEPIIVNNMIGWLVGG